MTSSGRSGPPTPVLRQGGRKTGGDTLTCMAGMRVVRQRQTQPALRARPDAGIKAGRQRGQAGKPARQASQASPPAHQPTSPPACRQKSPLRPLVDLLPSPCNRYRAYRNPTRSTRLGQSRPADPHSQAGRTGYALSWSLGRASLGRAPEASRPRGGECSGGA